MLFQSYCAFLKDKKLIQGELFEIALHLQRHGIIHDVLIFDNQTGKQIDVDISGNEQDILQRYSAVSVKKVGRPKLGVISKEITLLKKQWDWLEQQSGNISATLRKLIDIEMNNPASETNQMRRKQSIDCFMMTMLGDLGMYEEASRALYRGDEKLFFEQIKNAPQDILAHLHELAEPIFNTPSALG